MAQYSSTNNHKFDRWLNNAATFERDWRSDNNINFDYYDGEQWTDADAKIVEDRGQQATVLNVMRPTVDMVLALEAERRLNTRVTGREESDSLTARLLTELLSQVNEENDKDFYMAQCFREGIIGGRGWSYIHPVEDESGEMQIEVDQLPWEEVYIDPFHRKPDGSDARFIIRCQWEDRDVVKERFGEKADDIDSAFDERFKNVESRAQQQTDGGIEYYDQKTERVRLCHCWYRDAKKKLKYVLFAEDIFLIGSEDGENEDPIGVNMYPLVPFTAFRKKGGEPQGLIKLIRDAQDQINKLNSKYLWSVSANRITVEEDAVDDVDAYAAEMQKPNGVGKVSEGGLNKIRIEDNNRDLSGLSNQLNFMLEMIQRTSGINDSMIGIGGTNERSAQQGRQRMVQGAKISTAIMENFYFTNKRIAKVTLRQIAEFYDEERVIRIVEPNGATTHLKVNEPYIDPNTGELEIFANINDVLRYDVILKETAPFSSTQEITLQYVSEMGKAGIIDPEIAQELLITLSDIPHKEELLFRAQELQKQRAEQQAALAEQEAQNVQ